MNLKETIERYKNSKFFRNVLIVASGTAMAQAITVAFSPVITRLYGPEAFGLLGIFLSITHTLAPLAGLSYQNAIVLPKDEAEAQSLERLAILISFGMAGIVLIIFILFGNIIFSFFNAEGIGNFIYLVPLTIIFAGYYQTTRQVLLRKKLFKASAKIEILQAFLMNALKSGIGLFYPLGAALILIATADNALVAAMQQRAISRNKEKTKKLSLSYIAKKHYNFPVYQAPQMLFGNFSPSIPVFLLAGFFGPAAAGFYSLGRKVLTMTTSIIGRSVASVFYPHIAEAIQQKKNLRRPLVKATMALVIVGLIPFGSVFVAGPWLFSFVFGRDWVKAGEYARWISLWSFAFFINRPSTSLLNALRLQKNLFFFEPIHSCLLAGGLYIGFYFLNSDVHAVIISSALGATMYVWLLMYTFLKVKKMQETVPVDGQV